MADLAIRNYRAVFISDVHLGTKGCQAELLLDFIRHIECESLSLVGDIVDGWKLRSGWHWPQAHNDVVQKILRLARKGVNVIYVPGNHDRPIRRFCGLMLPAMQVRRRAIHTTLDGRRLLVTHGDDYDGVTHFGGLQEKFGDWLYYRILTGNRLTNQLRRRLGLRYWSLAEYLKRQSDAAERYIARFVHAGLEDARRRGLDGIVCGHIHRAALLQREGLLYANDGDWVESLTALSEEADGSLCLLAHTGQVLSHVAPRLRLVAHDVPHAA